MKYKVVPFNQSQNPSQELKTIIDREAVDGWEYVNHEYSHYLKPGSAGCFGFGAQPDMVLHTGMVVFGKSA